MSENLDIFRKCPNRLNLLQGVLGVLPVTLSEPFLGTLGKVSLQKQVRIFYSQNSLNICEYLESYWICICNTSTAC